MSKIRDKIKGLFNNKNYSLLEAIKRNPIYSIKNRVGRHNRAILFIKDKLTMHPKNRPILVGTMVTFRYLDPKYKDKLDYYDSFPLVIILGYAEGVNKQQLEMGLNLHYFPPDIRYKVLDTIYKMYERIYDKARREGVAKAFNINYKTIMAGLKKYKPEFALRSYIPSRRSKTFEIPVNHWESAIFIEPKFKKKGTAFIHRMHSKFKTKK